MAPKPSIVWACVMMSRLRPWASSTSAWVSGSRCPASRLRGRSAPLAIASIFPARGGEQRDDAIAVAEAAVADHHRLAAGDAGGARGHGYRLSEGAGPKAGSRFSRLVGV